MKYRKKPVTIDAVRYGPDLTPSDEVVNFLSSCKYWQIDDVFGGIILTTLEGDMLAKPGDWIIKGVYGEFYPCKHEIFEATYEKVE